MNENYWLKVDMIRLMGWEQERIKVSHLIKSIDGRKRKLVVKKG